MKIMRVKIIKNFGSYKRGEIVYLRHEEALGLLKKGIAIKTKDMTNVEIDNG